MLRFYIRRQLLFNRELGKREKVPARQLADLVAGPPTAVLPTRSKALQSVFLSGASGARPPPQSYWPIFFVEDTTKYEVRQFERFRRPLGRADATPELRPKREERMTRQNPREVDDTFSFGNRGIRSLTTKEAGDRPSG